jgi:hypothetical protein
VLLPLLNEPLLWLGRLLPALNEPLLCVLLWLPLNEPLLLRLKRLLLLLPLTM